MKSTISRTGLFIAICFAITTCSYGQYGNYGIGNYGGGYGGGSFGNGGWGGGSGYGGWGGYGRGGGYDNPVHSLAGYGYGGGYGGYGSGYGGYGGGYGGLNGMNSAIIPGSAASKNIPTVNGTVDLEAERAQKHYLKYVPPMPLSTYESTNYNWWSKEGNDLGTGYWQPGGATGRVGSPYFYSASNGNSANNVYGSSLAYNNGGIVDNGIVTDSDGVVVSGGTSSGGFIHGGSTYIDNSAGFGGGGSGYIGGRGRSGGSYHGSRHVFSTHPDGLYNAGQDAWGYHFGPGYYRHSENSHYRFPYYSYRRPWYFQGPASKNRNTNFAW